MEQPPRYDEISQDVEEEESMSPVIMALVVPPPSPEDTRPSTPTPPEDPKDENDPPPYNVATTLPSYDDVQKQKETEPLVNDYESGGRERDIDMDLGGDVMFICTFIIAFIFNWIGLLFSFCMTTTVAGRYGAISGFGLSIVKWVVIMMHTASLNNYVDTLPCLWWILLILGLMLFLRGAIMYVKVKRQFTTGIRTRFNYFYIY
ncbi:NEDD4 family-interacting protein 1-like [Ptychodera flava]|uniref:NEDD4 family-interacting protein 1-like n=1 Tax=Ptychodera flava TaxID=63121 RepID=UPI00396A4AFD